MAVAAMHEREYYLGAFGDQRLSRTGEQLYSRMVEMETVCLRRLGADRATEKRFGRWLGNAHALATAPFSATVSALPQMVLAEGAVTVLVAKRDSSWKIVHSHYSYPTIRR